jgi:hypothetical protein
VAEVERGDLRDVVLVGHSYSGIPVGQAAVVARPFAELPATFSNACSTGPNRAMTSRNY